MPADLERRLRAMAERWQYTDDELTEVLNRSRAGPAGWLRGIIEDEQRDQEIDERGQLKTDA